MTTKSQLMGSLLLFNMMMCPAIAGVDGLHQFWIDKTHENTQKIENYSARISQTDRSEQSLIAAVKYRKPGEFLMQVEAPERLKGLSISYQDNRLVYYSPQEGYFMAINGLIAPSAAGEKQRVADMYWANHEHYERTFTPSIEVADRISVGVDLDAKEDESELQKSSLFIDYDYSIVMKGDFYFKDGSVFSVNHDEIQFNSDNFNMPDKTLPAVNNSRSWNLSANAVSPDALKTQLKFPVEWPDTDALAWGLEQKTFHLSEQGAAHVAGYYRNDNYFLLTTAEQGEESPALDVGTPLIFSDEVTVHLLQAPNINSLHFQLKDVSYRLISNIHTEDLIAIARQMVN